MFFVVLIKQSAFFEVGFLGSLTLLRFCASGIVKSQGRNSQGIFTVFVAGIIKKEKRKKKRKRRKEEKEGKEEEGGEEEGEDWTL